MTGKRIGLVIGNNYPNSNKELKCARADVTKMKEILENTDICYFDKVVILNDKTSRDAAAEIEKLFKNAHQNDLIFIYFSGHGKKDFTNTLYLLFDDTNDEFLMATSLSFDFIYKCRQYPTALKASVVIYFIVVIAQLLERKILTLMKRLLNILLQARLFSLQQDLLVLLQH